MVMELVVVSRLCAKRIILAMVQEPLGILKYMALRRQGFAKKRGIGPKDISDGSSLLKRSCLVIKHAFLGKCGKLHLGINTL